MYALLIIPFCLLKSYLLSEALILSKRKQKEQKVHTILSRDGLIINIYTIFYHFILNTLLDPFVSLNDIKLFEYSIIILLFGKVKKVRK